jgi:hypothetical protein
MPAPPNYRQTTGGRKNGKPTQRVTVTAPANGAHRPNVGTAGPSYTDRVGTRIFQVDRAVRVNFSFTPS